MKNFFAFFAGRHLQAMLFTILVILLGIASLLQIKRDIFPKVDFGEVIITTIYPGASPEDVELNVTNEIEDEIKTVSNIDKITSYSMENISVITVSIDLEVDDKDEVRSNIREAVNRVTDLPREVTEAPRIQEIDNEAIPIIEVGISGDIPYRELRDIARLFKKKLENIPGVSRLEEYWYLDREIKVEVDPQALEEYQISLQEIAAAIDQRNIRLSGGTFESYSSEKSLLTLSKFRTPEEAAEVIVRSTFGGPMIRVKDLANIDDDFEEARIISRMNGKPAITFQVIKKGPADIIRTVDDIMSLIEDERAEMQAGVEILVANDLSYYVRNRFNVVLSNGAIGLALVLLVLTVFLNIRAALWVALSVPVVILGVILLLPVMGAYLDVLALTGLILVIGIVVDDGIIVAENIYKKREEGEKPLDAAVSGFADVAKPVFTTLLTTFLAFAPLYFMSGVAGDFVVSIPLVISLALLVSAAELLIALPAHLRPGLKKVKSSQKKENRHWFDHVRKLFKKVINVLLKLRYLFLLFSLLLFASAIWYATTQMKLILFPTSAADNFSVYAELPIGASLDKTANEIKKIEAMVDDLPDDELASYTTRVGSHGQRHPGENENWAVINVYLTPFSERDRTADTIVAQMREKTAQMQEFKEVSYTIDAGGPPVGKPITLRLVGSNDSLRRNLTDSVVTYLQTIEGVRDINRNDTRGKTQVQLEMDYSALSRLGLNVASLARTVRIAYDGEEVTSVRYGEQDVDFRLILEESARADTSYLPDLLIPNVQGRLIRLGDVAGFSTSPGPMSYYHYDRERTTIVTSELDTKKFSPLQVTSMVLDHFNLDENWPGMRIVVGGEAEETEESFTNLFITFGVAVIAIFFVLILLFNSVTQPLAVMIAIPFGIISVILTFVLHNETPGFIAMMGLVGLSGVVVNDSLVLVNHINKLREKMKGVPIREIVAQGTTDRLRAVIMTTTTTVAGLLPLAYGLGGSDPFIAPMALAMGYGLLFATPLTLVLVPSLYLIRTDIISLLKKIFRRS